MAPLTEHLVHLIFFTFSVLTQSQTYPLGPHDVVVAWVCLDETFQCDVLAGSDKTGVVPHGEMHHWFV